METGKGEGGGQRPSGVNLDAQLFMHPGQRGPSLAPRTSGGRGAARAPDGPGTRGRGEPTGRRAERCTYRPRQHPTKLHMQGSPRRRHTLRSPRLPERVGDGWSRARSRPPEPPPQSRPPPPAPAVSGPLPQSLTRGLHGLGRGGGSGDPRLGHDPRRVRQGCPTAQANLSPCGRRLLLWGWGSAGPGPPLPPPPPPLLAATAAAASPSPQGRRPGGSAASTFPAPLPPPLPAPPRPSRGRRSASEQPTLCEPRSRPCHSAHQPSPGEAATIANQNAGRRCARLEGGSRWKENGRLNGPQAAQ